MHPWGTGHFDINEIVLKTSIQYFIGDLIDNMVKFAGMIGWTEDMVQLITKEEGEFKIVSKAYNKMFKGLSECAVTNFCHVIV